MASIYIQTTNKDSDYLSEELLKSFFSGLSMEELLELTVVTQTLAGLAEKEIGGRSGLTELTKNIPGFYDGTETLRLELDTSDSTNHPRDVSINLSLIKQDMVNGNGPVQRF